MTARQEQFVREYLIDLNARQAAIRAGYSEQTATAHASRLMKLPAVVEAIEAGKNERSAITKVCAQWVLRRLVDEAQADLADLYDAETGALLPVEQWPLIWRQGLVQGVDISVERDGDGREIAIVKKIRVSDRVRRLELIGKHIEISAFAETIKHQVTDGLAARLERARAILDEDEIAPRPPAPARPVQIAPPELSAGRVTHPEPMPAAAEEIIAAAPAYQPLGLWPEPVGNAATEYDVFSAYGLD